MTTETDIITLDTIGEGFLDISSAITNFVKEHGEFSYDNQIIREKEKHSLNYFSEYYYCAKTKIDPPYEVAEVFNFLANALGFDAYEDMIFWIENNPEIWGNENGSSMFFDENAYNGGNDYKVTIHTICAHFKFVSDQIEERIKEL